MIKNYSTPRSTTFFLSSLTFIFLFSAGCSSLLYYPSQSIYVDQTQLPIKPQEVELQSKGKDKIVGWYFDANPKSEPRGVFLFFHGNAQNISSHFVALYWLLDLGYDFFIFDYPGYGGSTGEPTPASTVQAGHAAYDYVKSLWPQKPLVVFGQSLGGAVALQTTIEREVDRPCLLVVESTFNSYQSAAAQVLKKQWWTWPLHPLAYIVLSDTHAPISKIKKIAPTPLIVVHGDKDPVIELRLGRRIYKEAQEPKEFWPVHDGQHIDTFTGKQRLLYRKQLVERVQKYCQFAAKKL